jgi:hypothetical protein
MKNIYFNISKVVFLAFFLMNYISVAQVGIGTTTPDASSMLDIQSDAKGVLIPRMLTSQRTAILTPANGLLVFDTDTQSFWFYGGSWTELSTGSPSTVSDIDGDTKIEVEQSSDEDIIRLSSAATERMIIDNTGITEIGTPGTNYTKIEADGSLSYEGTATRYDDLRVPVSSTTREGSKSPTMTKFRETSEGSQGVLLQFFHASNEQELYFVVQMPHGWKEGTDIYPHVHWTSTSLMNGVVVWGLEYTWSNHGGAFGDTTIITGDTTVNVPSSANEMLITSLPTISGTDKTISSVLICRIFRDAANTSDSFTGEAGLIEIDFHYQIDSDGSREQLTK